MADDEAALPRLWREKRGEVEPEDLSGDLIVRFGVVTAPPNATGSNATAAVAICAYGASENVRLALPHFRR